MTISETVGPTPSLSAIVLSYTRKNFLPMALDSLLRQAPQFPQEVLLVTPVALPEISKDYTERFRTRGVDFRTLLTGWGPVGQAIARGTQEARGEILALIDDDDKWEPAKTSKVLQAFAADPKLTYLHNGVTLVDVLNRPLGRSNPHRCVRHRSTLLAEGAEVKFRPGTGDDPQDLFKLEPMFNNSSISLRRSVVLPWVSQLRRVEGGEDGFLFYCALVGGGAIGATTDRLTRVTVHRSAATALALGQGTYDDRVAHYREFVRRNLERIALSRELVVRTHSEIGADLLARESSRWSVFERISSVDVPVMSVTETLSKMMQGDWPAPTRSDLVLMGLALSSVISSRLTRAAWLSWRIVW